MTFMSLKPSFAALIFAMAIWSSGKFVPRENPNGTTALIRVESVNGFPAEKSRERIKFEQLTPIFPDQRIDLETKNNILSNRLINLIAPIGRGQRAMIVSPPKSRQDLHT